MTFTRVVFTPASPHACVRPVIIFSFIYLRIKLRHAIRFNRDGQHVRVYVWISLKTYYNWLAVAIIRATDVCRRKLRIKTRDSVCFFFSSFLTYRLATRSVVVVVVVAWRGVPD